MVSTIQSAPSPADVQRSHPLHIGDLSEHLRRLITLEVTKDPVVSCYLNLEHGLQDALRVLYGRMSVLRTSVTRDGRAPCEDAVARIESFLTTEVTPTSKGVAIFARGGEFPFFLPLQFQVPLPDRIVVEVVPNVYHLVELKDNYHRFVILLMTERSARIMEVNLGAVTEEIWAQRPESHEHIGHGWGKAQYMHHREQETGAFIREKVNALDRVMATGGHTHLILAGDAQMVTRMQKALPKHLAVKLVDFVTTSPRDRTSSIVAKAIASFVKQEEAESIATACLLERELRRHGLAVVGTRAVLAVISRGQADVLVLAQGYEPGTGWTCTSCEAIHLAPRMPELCSECAHSGFREFNPKEEMVRLAQRHGCKVEVVAGSESLVALGGVGCLLRYHPHQSSVMDRSMALAQAGVAYQ
jgi:hypothetical protein